MGTFLAACYLACLPASLCACIPKVHQQFIKIKVYHYDEVNLQSKVGKFDEPSLASVRRSMFIDRSLDSFLIKCMNDSGMKKFENILNLTN
jgi:hypothetical protein